MDHDEPAEALGRLPLSPFFSFIAELQTLSVSHQAIASRRGFSLPNTGIFLDEKPIATTFAAWNKEALFFAFHLPRRWKKASFRHCEQGDALELWIDTRNVKSKVLNAFCHHLLILPEPEQGVSIKEITRLRAETSRPLLAPKDATIFTTEEMGGYTLFVELRKSGLYGFDPAVSPEIGFAYRLHAAPNKQHFALSSKDFSIENSPHLWGTLRLMGSGSLI